MVLICRLFFFLFCGFLVVFGVFGEFGVVACLSVWFWCGFFVGLVLVFGFEFCVGYWFVSCCVVRGDVLGWEFDGVWWVVICFLGGVVFWLVGLLAVGCEFVVIFLCVFSDGVCVCVVVFV